MNIIEKLKTLESVYYIVTGETLIVQYLKIDDHIVIEKPSNQIMLSNEGKTYTGGECLLFPSKENRDWGSIINCRFKKGDPVMVKQIKSDLYQLRYHSGKNPIGLDICYDQQKKYGEMTVWDICISLEEFLEL